MLKNAKSEPKNFTLQNKLFRKFFYAILVEDYALVHSGFGDHHDREGWIIAESEGAGAVGRSVDSC